MCAEVAVGKMSRGGIVGSREHQTKILVGIAGLPPKELDHCALHGNVIFICIYHTNFYFTRNISFSVKCVLMCFAHFSMELFLISLISGSLQKYIISSGEQYLSLI